MSGAASPNPGATAKSRDGDLTLIVDGQQYVGWEAIRVTRGCERMPSDFDIQLSESQSGRTLVAAGSPCVVKLGNDTVLTGYIDRYTPSIGPSAHTVRIAGRSA